MPYMSSLVRSPQSSNILLLMYLFDDMRSCCLSCIQPVANCSNVRRGFLVETFRVCSRECTWTQIRFVPSPNRVYRISSFSYLYCVEWDVTIPHTIPVTCWCRYKSTFNDYISCRTNLTALTALHKGSDISTELELLLAHRGSFGRMPFVPPPASWTQARWVHIRYLNGRLFMYRW